MAYIINLFGAPGSGKSTGAAYIFSALKMAGINAELVTEYAKDLTWEENSQSLSNSALVFGEQFQRIDRCFDKVDIIITDSPILLSTIYNKHPALGSAFIKSVKETFDFYSDVSLNYYINRKKDYNPIGRNQTEEQANRIGRAIRVMLDENGYVYDVVDGSKEGYNSIIDDIIYKLLAR